MASADPITVAFTVIGAPEDPLNRNVTARGTFSFDSSLAAPDAILFGQDTGLGATSIQFPWSGVFWDTSNADLFFLWFDANANLINWVLAGFPGGSAICTCPDLAPDVIVDSVFLGLPPGYVTFYYTTTGRDIYTGSLLDWHIVPQAPVPEPATFVLLGTGLVLSARRRVWKATLRTAADRSPLVDARIANRVTAVQMTAGGREP